MNPKDLKGLYDQKATREQAARDEEIVLAQRDADERARRSAIGRKALKEEIIPYLHEVKSEFRGKFTIDPPTTDAITHEIVGTAFQLEGCPKFRVSVLHGQVSVTEHAASQPDGHGKNITASIGIENVHDLNTITIGEIIRRCIEDEV